jgi:transmembrane sensor
METPKTGLAEVGERIRSALDEDVDAAAQLQRARGRLLRRVTLDNAARARAGWLGPAFTRGRRVWGASLALGALAAVGLWRWHLKPISFQVVAGAGLGRLGDVVEANGAEPVGLRFSDGSSIVMHAGGRLRVLSTEATGARVLIENGGMDVAIRHERPGRTVWSFDAGAFSVRVVGTAFHLAYDAGEHSLDLATSEGAVLISGACLNQPRAVVAGERVRLVCVPNGEGRVATGSAQEPAPILSVPVESSPVLPSAPGADWEAGGVTADLSEQPQAAEKEATRPKEMEGNVAAKSRTWRDLLNTGPRGALLEAAEQAGFEQVCATASLKELVQLADAARLEGRAALATAALHAVRQRFAGSSAAGTAAFTLGRIAFEQRAAYAEAARWFKTYVDEVPSGPLLGDAIGRLMESRQRAGHKAAARRDAERYLQRFPGGPYAAQAKGILAE